MICNLRFRAGQTSRRDKAERRPEYLDCVLILPHLASKQETHKGGSDVKTLATILLSLAMAGFVFGQSATTQSSSSSTTTTTQTNNGKAKKKTQHHKKSTHKKGHHKTSTTTTTTTTQKPPHAVK